MDKLLLIELGRAGYPQTGDGKLVDANAHAKTDVVDNLYEPTLTELLYSCGDSFVDLMKTEDGWRAMSEDGSLGKDHNPKNAVAKLWISMYLNKIIND